MNLAGEKRESRELKTPDPTIAAAGHAFSSGVVKFDPICTDVAPGVTSSRGLRGAYQRGSTSRVCRVKLMKKEKHFRCKALACDYDATLAWEGVVPPETVSALHRFKKTGKRLVMVTGRLTKDVPVEFAKGTLFDRIVSENGAVLCRPATSRVRQLVQAPSPEFVEALHRKGIHPAIGDVIIATHQPHETAILETIRDLGLELHITFNRGAVMILPSGINKASGLVAALDELGLKPSETAGIGDAENDHAFLELCGLSAVVANALPALHQEADIVMTAANGRGVTEFINLLLQG